MFLRVTLDKGDIALVNLDKVRMMFPYKGHYVAIEMDSPESSERDVRYTKNDFYETEKWLFTEGIAMNAAPEEKE